MPDLLRYFNGLAVSPHTYYPVSSVQSVKLCFVTDFNLFFFSLQFADGYLMDDAEDEYDTSVDYGKWSSA